MFDPCNLPFVRRMFTRKFNSIVSGLLDRHAAWPVYWSAEQTLGRSESESSYEQEDSSQVFGLPPSPEVEEGLDEVSRELEIINRNRHIPSK